MVGLNCVVLGAGEACSRTGFSGLGECERIEPSLIRRGCIRAGNKCSGPWQSPECAVVYDKKEQDGAAVLWVGRDAEIGLRSIDLARLVLLRVICELVVLDTPDPEALPMARRRRDDDWIWSVAQLVGLFVALGVISTLLHQMVVGIGSIILLLVTLAVAIVFGIGIYKLMSRRSAVPQRFAFDVSMPGAPVVPRMSPIISAPAKEKPQSTE